MLVSGLMKTFALEINSSPLFNGSLQFFGSSTTFDGVL